jgi:hypothetical protein
MSRTTLLCEERRDDVGFLRAVRSVRGRGPPIDATASIRPRASAFAAAGSHLMRTGAHFTLLRRVDRLSQARSLAEQVIEFFHNPFEVVPRVGFHSVAEQCKKR